MAARSSRRGLLDEARAVLARAGEARRTGEHRGGTEAAARALELARSANNRGLQASALRLLALHQWRLGEEEAAISACLQALPMLRRKRNAGERSDVLCTLVMAYNSLGLHADALEHVTEVLDAARASGDLSLLSWALNRVGVTYEALADRREAEHFLLQALEIARQIKGDEEMFSALNNLCSGLMAMARAARDGVGAPPTADDLQRALAYGEEALALAHASGNSHREAISHGNLATLHLELCNFDTALMHIERERELALAHGYRALIHASVVDRAELARRCGDLPGAIALFEEALADAQHCEDPGSMLEVCTSLYSCCKSIGDFATALQHHEAMLLLEREKMRRVIATQARLLINRLELEHARVDAERAHLDAQVQRLRAMQLETEKRQLEQKASELGRHALEDQLTGLANRRRIDHELPLKLAAAHERGEPLSIALIDLDHFKHVNDRFGHGVGDDVLRAVAAILLDNIRGADVLARMGGEEFIVVFGSTAIGVATEICERLRRAVEAHGWHEVARGLQLTISIGVCDAERSVDMRGLVERADTALYQAKRDGRNRVQVAGVADYIDASSIAR
jgi:diguanylate cyclase (GGDEF)-like protein